MKKIGILYGPLGGNTEKVARKVADAFGSDATTLIPVKNAVEADIIPFDCIVFGGPTVGTHTWQDTGGTNDWDMFLTKLGQMDLEGKKCAIFGLGDHVAYAHHFVDDIGVMAERLEEAGANLIGKVSVDGYSFHESKAQRGNSFLGLPIDEDFEADLTDERIKNWVLQLKKEL